MTDPREFLGLCPPGSRTLALVAAAGREATVMPAVAVVAQREPAEPAAVGPLGLVG